MVANGGVVVAAGVVGKWLEYPTEYREKREMREEREGRREKGDAQVRRRWGCVLVADGGVGVAASVVGKWLENPFG